MIFIDEAGFNQHLRRSQARSRRNTRAVVTVPTVGGRNVSLILALNNRGVVHSKVIAQGTTNAELFVEFLAELRQKVPDPDNLIIMDNARIHKAAAVKRFIEEVRFQVHYLPPYSPMFNPVEKAFSKIKCHARNILSEPDENHILTQVIDKMRQNCNSN
uniref:Insertion element IS630 uncharacterized 39 kDa protein n=1 Tax=Lygus hesperus TaxID=30085 RepID=A0A0A9XRL8_LYGHE